MRAREQKVLSEKSRVNMTFPSERTYARRGEGGEGKTVTRMKLSGTWPRVCTPACE